MSSSVQLQKPEEGKDVSLRKPQNGAKVSVNNRMDNQMQLGRHFSWSGVPSGGKFPPTIGSNSFISFDHLKAGSYGSKAFVVYDAPNASTHDCSWLLAWEAPAETDVSPNKVYVLAGLKSEIHSLSDSEIEARLDNGNVKSVSRDETTKTMAEAAINELNPLVATVGATFNLITP